MKFTQVKWEEVADAENDDDEDSGHYADLCCPICGTSWLNVSEKLGEFNEYECNHLVFRWYQDGDPEEIHIEQKVLERAFQEALIKLDNTINVSDSHSVGLEVDRRRTDDEFWQAFQCPGIDEIVYGLNDNGTDIFGLRRDIPAE